MSPFQLIVPLGISLALVACGTACAADLGPSQPDTVVVRTDDVNLHTQSGARQMALRIRNAAAVACGANVDPIAIRFSDGFRRCREAAIDHALQGLNAAQVADALDRSPQRLSRGD